MKINVGSKNPVKINAVIDTLKLYPQLFKNPTIEGVDINTDEFGHPKSIKEVIEGALERAKSSFYNCEYSFGLEGGLIKVPETESGYMEINACVVYNGSKTFIGLSPAFEWPIKVTKLILANKADASLAFKSLGLTDSSKMGAQKGGIVGYMTNNRMTREDQIKYSIIMALIYLEKPALR